MKPISSQVLKSTLELTFAGVLWGFGFIANIWCLSSLSPSAIVFYRFVVSGLFGLSLFPILKIKRKDIRGELRIAIFSGLSLGLCLFLQTWGLQYTTATNSGFITTLYVVIVPFVARVALKDRLQFVHWICVALAMVGTLMIVQVTSLEFNIGDLVTLACAFVASVQIVYLSHAADRIHQPFVLNTLQSLWAGAPFALALLRTGEPSHWVLTSLSTKAWVGLLSLTFFSTSLAFYLQIRAQKHLTSSHASLLYLLESPFAYGFAYFLLGERMQPTQMMGAGLIFVSCVLATRTFGPRVGAIDQSK